MPTPLHQELLDFQADHVWVDQNRETLLAQYPDQWIAVRHGQVIAHDPDIDRLLKKLADPARTCVEFVAREPLETIL